MNIPLADAIEALRMIADRKTPNQGYDFCDSEFAAGFLTAAQTGRTAEYLAEAKREATEEQYSN